jgi:gamma-glutamylaminecyclotransferase
MSLVFVYGTLKRGGSNHAHLAGQEFVGVAKTKPSLALYLLDGYPGMVPVDEGGESIVGEVWSVDDACLAKLDDLEGLSEGLYRRGAIPLEGPLGERGVEAYYYERSVTGRPRVAPEWKV